MRKVRTLVETSGSERAADPRKPPTMRGRRRPLRQARSVGGSEPNLTLLLPKRTRSWRTLKHKSRGGSAEGVPLSLGSGRKKEAGGVW